ncbi:TPA: hypothetical protein DDW35_11860, partial [Candidatus Sumerlaeota bacterium]|nr:hypothetical protein [Candidatus Sumerlaeota bacterium]
APLALKTDSDTTNLSYLNTPKILTNIMKIGGMRGWRLVLGSVNLFRGYWNAGDSCRIEKHSSTERPSE